MMADLCSCMRKAFCPSVSWSHSIASSLLSSSRTPLLCNFVTALTLCARVPWERSSTLFAWSLMLETDLLARAAGSAVLSRSIRSRNCQDLMPSLALSLSPNWEKWGLTLPSLGGGLVSMSQYLVVVSPHLLVVSFIPCIACLMVFMALLATTLTCTTSDFFLFFYIILSTCGLSL